MKTAYIFILIPVLLIIVLFTLVLPGPAAVKADYRPVLSGDFEVGDRLYTEYNELEEEEEEVLDTYFYRRGWLKYKQKLTPSDYYYFKFQYYKKEYDDQQTYNNVTLNLWGNYTYELTEKLRNRWKANFKDKDYLDRPDNSYRSLRLQYQLDYDYDRVNDYTFYLQRQWEDYRNDPANYNTRDRISLEWERELRDGFDINTTFQYERQQYNYDSDRSNKYGRKLSIGFDYEL